MNSFGRADPSIDSPRKRAFESRGFKHVFEDLRRGGGEAEEAGVGAFGNVVSTQHVGRLAGCSIEDFDGTSIYPRDAAIERISAAVEVNPRSDSKLMLTARAENFIHGNPDLTDTIERLQAYQEAGADVLYAPGLMQIEDIRTLISALDRPVNILLLPSGPPIPELFEAGAIRASTDSAISMAPSPPLWTRPESC